MVTKRQAIENDAQAVDDVEYKNLLEALPPSYFEKFAVLSKERQNKLLKHFRSEFDMTTKAARADLLALSEAEIAPHLDAALNGYI